MGRRESRPETASGHGEEKISRSGQEEIGWAIENGAEEGATGCGEARLYACKAAFEKESGSVQETCAAASCKSGWTRGAGSAGRVLKQSVACQDTHCGAGLEWIPGRTPLDSLG